MVERSTRILRAVARLITDPVTPRLAGFEKRLDATDVNTWWDVYGVETSGVRTGAFECISERFELSPMCCECFAGLPAR
jgi:hypothetical protein